MKAVEKLTIYAELYQELKDLKQRVEELEKVVKWLSKDRLKR